jgi:hypothetical protein
LKWEKRLGVQLADGSFSNATIDILVTGTNDAAVIPSTFVRLTEGDTAEDISTSGTLSISDVDSPELFVAEPELMSANREFGF